MKIVGKLSSETKQLLALASLGNIKMNSLSLDVDLKAHVVCKYDH